MRAKETWVINLFGGPGCGKTTLAFHLCYLIKKAGYEVHYANELAKWYALSEDDIGPHEQARLVLDQLENENEYYGLVDFIVTDAPPELNTFYGNHRGDEGTICSENHVKTLRENYSNPREFNGVSGQVIVPRVVHYDLQLVRDPEKIYKDEGRYQSRMEALNCDILIPQYVKHVYQLYLFPLESEGIIDFTQQLIKDKNEGTTPKSYRPGSLAYETK